MILHNFYYAYIDCLNRQAWDTLELYIAENVRHNGATLACQVTVQCL